MEFFTRIHDPQISNQIDAAGSCCLLLFAFKVWHNIKEFVVTIIFKIDNIELPWLVVRCTQIERNMFKQSLHLFQFPNKMDNIGFCPKGPSIYPFVHTVGEGVQLRWTLNQTMKWACCLISSNEQKVFSCLALILFRICCILIQCPKVFQHCFSWWNLSACCYWLHQVLIQK